MTFELWVSFGIISDFFLNLLVTFELWVAFGLWVTFELWLSFLIMGDLNNGWLLNYGWVFFFFIYGWLLNCRWGDRQTSRHTDRHKDTSIPWLGLAKGPGQVKIFKISKISYYKIRNSYVSFPNVFWWIISSLPYFHKPYF